MSAVSWGKFFSIVLPLLSDLARELFKLFNGDPEAAAVELRRSITDYGAQRREQEKLIDAQLAVARAAKEPGP